METDEVAYFDPSATYSAAALDYDYASCHYWAGSAERAVELADLGPGMTVLDAGCGAGAATIPAAFRVRPGGHVVAVDFSPEMLALATHRASRFSLHNIEWRLEDMRAYRPPAQFDAVLCVLALYCVEDMIGLAAALWQLVRPGGRLVVVTPGREVLSPLYDLFYAAARRARPGLILPRPWRRIDTHEALAAVLEQTGAAHATITEERVVVPLRAPDDWWRIVRGSGLYRAADLLGPEAARVQTENLRAIAEDNILSLSSCYLYAVAEKKMATDMDG